MEKLQEVGIIKNWKTPIYESFLEENHIEVTFGEWEEELKRFLLTDVIKQTVEDNKQLTSLVSSLIEMLVEKDIMTIANVETLINSDIYTKLRQVNKTPLCSLF